MKIFIFGLGAIGSNLLLQLVKMYPDIEFYGIDYDKVEDRNINTQAYILPHVGMNKTDAMIATLGINIKKYMYHPINQKVEKFSDVFDLLNLPSEENFILIDCFDNSKSRSIFSQMTKEAQILHIGFSPQYTAEIIWNENYSVPNDIPEDQNDICEMREAVSFINFVVSRASGIVSNFIENNVKEDYIIINKYEVKKL